MEYNDFVRKATAEDSRNRFSEGVSVAIVSPELSAFYACFDPSDVEVFYPGIGTIKWCSSDELETIQGEYSLRQGDCIFATCNGDPIFIHEGKIMMTSHDVYRPELLAESFDGFISRYLA